MAVSDAQGHFVLNNSPVDDHVPIVIQVGNWRRRIEIAVKNACADNPILDPTLTRLPTRPNETSPDDDMPTIALTTGGDDALECLLVGMGVDPNQFTSATGGGRVHLYQGAGGATLSGGVASATSFWADNQATGTQPFDFYDMILLGCEGGTYASEKPAAALQAMEQYADKGGNVVAFHDQYYWIESNPPPSLWSTTAVWNHAQDPANQTSLPLVINQAFPRGQNMAQLMFGTDASTTLGTFDVAQAHHDVDNAPNPSVTWLSTSPDAGKLVETYSFVAPVLDGGLSPNNECGKVVFVDMHAAPGNTPGGTFPANCTQGALTPQQQALEFLIFSYLPCY